MTDGGIQGIIKHILLILPRVICHRKFCLTEIIRICIMIPESFKQKKNEYGRYVMRIDDSSTVYLFGDGYTAEGQFPFIDALDLKTLKKRNVYINGPAQIRQKS